MKADLNSELSYETEMKFWGANSADCLELWSVNKVNESKAWGREVKFSWWDKLMSVRFASCAFIADWIEDWVLEVEFRD